MTAERARISAIIGGDEGKKRPKAALAAALETDMSAEVANSFLGKLPEEKAEVATAVPPKGKEGAAADFAAAMNNAEHPNLGQESAQTEEDKRKSRRHAALAAAGRLNVAK